MVLVNESRVVNANSNSDGNLNVNSNLTPDNRNSNIGGRSSAVVSCLFTFLEIFSSHQAFCQFLVEFVGVGYIFYCLELLYQGLVL